MSTVLKKMAKAHKLQVACQDEVNRLLFLAWEVGHTDEEIAEALEITKASARIRRARNASTRSARDAA